MTRHFFAPVFIMLPVGAGDGVTNYFTLGVLTTPHPLRFRRHIDRGK